MTRPTRSPTASDPDRILAEVARLRAEHERTESAVTRAILLHEIAVLEELAGDTAGARAISSTRSTPSQNSASRSSA